MRPALHVLDLNTHWIGEKAGVIFGRALGVN
jgi:hypothetical protein